MSRFIWNTAEVNVTHQSINYCILGCINSRSPNIGSCKVFLLLRYPSVILFSKRCAWNVWSEFEGHIWPCKRTFKFKFWNHRGNWNHTWYNCAFYGPLHGLFVLNKKRCQFLFLGMEAIPVFPGKQSIYSSLSRFRLYSHHMELEIKDTTDTTRSVSYIELHHLEIYNFTTKEKISIFPL